MDLPLDTKTGLIRHYPQKAWHYDYMAPQKYTKIHGTTFQSTMKVTIVMGQIFGLNPVLGVTERDATKLRFTVFSWRFVYSLVSIFGQGVLVIFCFLRLFNESENDRSFTSNSSLVFFSTNCLTTILFLRIATKWPRLSQQIARIEVIDPNPGSSLIIKCNAACIVILSLAALEHILSDLYDISKELDCPSGRKLYEAFVTSQFPEIYDFVSYNEVIGPLSQIVDIQCAFNWNFSDVFVICISLYLTSRLEQVNRRIVAVRGKYASSTFWRAMREDYCRAASLVRKVDDVIGGLVFISFANNLFFICLQLLNTLDQGVRAKPSCHNDGPDERPFKGYEQAVYFIYSFVFLVLRALAVSLIAAQVHTASTKPAHALYLVPSSAYCVEVQRFLDQIHTDTVALSGIKFFNVKRGLVLTIAGTIVTYELVLIQFTGVQTTPST